MGRDLVCVHMKQEEVVDLFGQWAGGGEGRGTERILKKETEEWEGVTNREKRNRPRNWWKKEKKRGRGEGVERGGRSGKKEKPNKGVPVQKEGPDKKGLWKKAKKYSRKRRTRPKTIKSSTKDQKMSKKGGKKCCSGLAASQSDSKRGRVKKGSIPTKAA